MLANKLKLTLGTICLMAILTLATLEYWRHQAQIEQEQERVSEELTDIRAELESILFQNLSIAHGTANHISFNPQISQADFALFARLQLSIDNQISHFAVAKDLIISHLYPIAGNEKAMGLNYRTNAAQIGDIEKAIESGQAVVTDIVNLVQGGRAIITRNPIFNAESGELWGVLSAVIKIDELITRTESLASKTSLKVVLTDDSSQGSYQENAFWGDAKILSKSPVSQHIYLPGNQWTISATPTGGWHQYQPNFFVVLFMVVLTTIACRIAYSRHQYELNYRRLTEEKLASEKEFRSKFEKLAHYDHLTQLPNRLLLSKMIAEHVEQDDTLAILFLDLDQFKAINDSLGHKAGDAILKLASSRIEHAISHQDTLARLGGDEFVVLLRGIDSKQQVAEIAQRIIKKVTLPYTFEHMEEIYIGVSIGIALYPEHSTSAEKLLEYADAAMYVAKNKSGSHYHFFDSQIVSSAEQNLIITAELRKAIRENEFVLVFQPQIDNKANKIIGAEALIRWQHPDKGLLSPFHFLPLAEEQGLIKDISNWVLKTSIEVLKNWQQQGIDIPLSVNISATDLDDPQFNQRVISLIETHQIAPQQLELEITENILIRNTELVVEHLKALQKHGVRVAIDDFGTGHSSLKYLKHLPINRLKIDKCFIDVLTEDTTDQALVSVIISMADILNVDVVAEGVEVNPQATLLEELGCNQIQGYLFDKPLSQTQLLAKYFNKTVI